MKYITITTFILIILLNLSINIKAQDSHKWGIDTINSDIPNGVQVDSIAPNFIAVDQNGNIVNLYNILEKKKVVLFFYRGNWCPYCNTYMKNLKDSLKYILDKNTEVIAISPESLENSIEMSDKTDPKLIIVSDTNKSIMKNYDVLFRVNNNYQRKIRTLLLTDIAKHNSQSEAYLPIPATFIINTNKKIEYKHFDENYKLRAPVKDILEVL